MAPVVDAREWDRGENSAWTIASYIQETALRPEDSYGVMPSGRGARELLFFHRDRPADAPAAPATAMIYVHSLQWPDTRGIDGWRPVEAAFVTYCNDVGLRPEDVYGWAPVTWDAQENHYRGFNLVYRDRREYAQGRSHFAGRGRIYEFDESGSFPGAPDAPPTEWRGGDIRADREGWPGAGLFRKAKGEKMIEFVRERIDASGLEPEDSFGMGPDKINENFWLVRRT